MSNKFNFTGAAILLFVRHIVNVAEAKRTAINAWIKESGEFDGVVDFASAVADPADPSSSGRTFTPAISCTRTTPGIRRWPTP